MRNNAFVILFILFSFSTIINLTAQKNSYYNELGKLVALFNNAKPNEDCTQLINDLEQLSQTAVGAKDWVPPYYLSLLYTRLSFKDKKNADLHADKAVQWANSSISLQTNDENFCAMTMAQTGKLLVNPMIRWLNYEKKIFEPLQKAKKINSNNPRIYILEASVKINMPVLFGGGCEKNKALLVKANQLLEKQIPDQILPTWGKQSLIDLKKACPF
jgi:hypothetical protein